VPVVCHVRSASIMAGIRALSLVEATWHACRCMIVVSYANVQGRQVAASVRRDLQKRYDRCAEVAFGSCAAAKEAGYEAAPLDTVVQVRDNECLRTMQSRTTHQMHEGNC
jgi:hypothetical protein